MADGMLAPDIKFAKQLAPNLITNLLSFIVNIIIGLLLVPFFLNTLGDVAYGLIPLATTITSYVTIVVDAMNSATSRFMTVELQRGEFTKAKETFNTGIFGILTVVLCLLPIALVFACFVPSFFNIGNEQPISVCLLFAFVFIAALVRMWGSNFTVTLFAYNRLDLRNWVGIANQGFQVGSVFLLFLVCGPSLPLVGISYLIGAVVSTLFSIYFSLKVCPEIVISIKYFSKKRLKEILGVSGWVCGSSLAFLLRYQVSLIIINIVLGAVAGAEYSLVITWTTLLLNIASIIITTFTPKSYVYRAQNDIEGLTWFTCFSMKVVGLFLALPLALVCVFAAPLMTIWVGAKYAILAPLIWINVIPLIIRIQTTCTDPIFQAYLRVKVPCIASIIIGIINIVLILLMIPLFEDGLYGIAYASLISLLITQGFFLSYNAIVLQKSLITFVRPLIYGVIPMSIITGIGMIITQFIVIENIFGIILFSLIFACIYLIVISRFVLKPKEKKLIRGCMPACVAKLIPQWIL